MTWAFHIFEAETNGSVPWIGLARTLEDGKARVPGIFGELSRRVPALEPDDRKQARHQLEDTGKAAGR